MYGVRTLVVAVALSFAMAPTVAMAWVPGDGNDGICDGRRASEFEHRVSDAQSFRAAVGLPDDRQHVVNVLRDPSRQIPVREWRQLLTPQEYAYYRARVTLAGETDLVTAYVKKTAGADFVSVRVEDDFPLGPYIAVRVAKLHHAQTPSL